MAVQAKLAAKTREEGVHTLRHQERIPAVVYGHGVKNLNIDVDGKQFTKVFKAAGYTALINIHIDQAKKDHTVLIREVQLHPVKDTILHVDFYQPRLDQAITAHVPLDFTGEAPAVKDLGGVLVRTIDEIELEALPTDLPHDIKVDISVLTDFEKVIRVADLDLPDKVKLHHEADEVVALVQPPRTEEELEALEEEVSEDVEGVEGVEEPEEAEEGEETEEPEEKTEADKPEQTEETKPE